MQFLVASASDTAVLLLVGASRPRGRLGESLFSGLICEGTRLFQLETSWPSLV